MNQVHSDLQVSSGSRLATGPDLQASNAQRLVVVIRDVEEEGLLAGRILELAQPRGLAILLLGIVRDSSREADLRRKLVTIAAFLDGGNSRAALSVRGRGSARAPEIRIEHGKDWMAAVRFLLQPGDMLACYSEQRGGVPERPLSDLLAWGLDMPIYIFAGLESPNSKGNNWLSQAASWLSSLASIGIFLLIQAGIVTDVQGWLQSALLLVVLVAEVGVLWFLNSLLAPS